MKRAFLVTSLVCSALVGCGDDKGGNDSLSTPTMTPSGDEDGNEGSSAGDTGGMSTVTESSQSDTNPTTAPDGTEGMTSNGPTTTPPPETTTGANFLVDIPTDTPMCDPFAQDCVEGEKCNPWADDGGSSWNADKCVPVTGDGVEGDACFAEGGGVAGLDDCAKGFYCWNVDADGNGVCVQLCTGNTEMGMCENTEKTCAVYNDGTLPICLDQCDPLSQNCPEGDACIGNPTGEGFLCVTDASGDEGQQHDPCMYANACDPGLLCNDPTAANECDPNATGCCEPFCDLTDPNADMNCGGEGQTCQPYFEEGTAPPDLEDVGFCAIPM